MQAPAGPVTVCIRLVACPTSCRQRDAFASFWFGRVHSGCVLAEIPSFQDFSTIVQTEGKQVFRPTYTYIEAHFVFCRGLALTIVQIYQGEL